MRVLLTNNTLDRPAGTELSIFDYAVSLEKRGHEVVAFSRQLGEIAERLLSRDIAVCEELDSVPWRPDVIHGHHRWETTLAALYFSEVPIVSFCRGTLPWQEKPCLAPNVVRWVGVDEPCCDVLRNECDLPSDRVSLIANGVDLERFPGREAPLPKRLKRVLVFSNYARENNFFGVIRRACDAEGIRCEGVGAGLKNAVSDPVPVLADSDLVFAKGKAALEAMVSGCGVVVCDENGMGPLVTRDTFEFVRSQSFAYGAMTDSVTQETVCRRLAEWDASELSAVARLARDEASLDRTVDRLEDCYQLAIATWQKGEAPKPEAYLRCASDLLSEATTPYKLGREAQEIWRRQQPATEQDSGATEMNRILHALRESESRVLKLTEKLGQREMKISALKEKVEAVKEERDKSKKRWFG